MDRPRSTQFATFENTIGYTFKDLRRGSEALHAPGSVLASTTDGNRLLALQGDAVLRMLIIDDMLAAGGSRAVIQETISRVVSNNNLDRVGRLKGLSSFISNNRSQRNTIAPTTMSATVEATIGAVWGDSGRQLDPVRQVTQTLGLWPEG
ncbi:hypothetical protein MMC13_001639 [Lambiella insularis]|nr:hypothetical protein [Lambiella insularis]